MELIGQIIRDVAALLLIAAIAELLLPSGPLSRFIRLAIGLMLVAMVVNPLLDRFSGGFEPPEFDFSQPAMASQYIAEGEALAEGWQAEAKEEYGDELERQIAATALLAEGVEQAAAVVEVAADGSLTTVQLGLVVAADADRAVVEERALQVVSGFFTAETWQVQSRIEEEGKDDGA